MRPPSAFTCAFLIWGCLACFLPAAIAADDFNLDNVPKRHDYRFTFKKPYFMYDEKSIPYWELTKGVLASNDSIRLTPSVPDHQGSVWSIRPNPYPEWQAVFSFSAFGRGFLGGEGLAFWYTEDRMIEGPMYGNKDAWKGLAVVFDTAEQAENRYTPYIYGVYNDGKEHYANRDDYVQTALSGCFRDYRNTPTPVFARITYANETLKVEIDLRQQGSGFTECFKATPIKLPTGYYFGISAATEAHLADDHDIYLFELTQLNPPPRKKEVERPHEAEHIAKEGQFQISEEMKENIEKVEKIVKNADEPHQIVVENPSMPELQKLQESQFHIMEGLNLILSHMDVSKKQGGGASAKEPTPAPPSKTPPAANDQKYILEYLKDITQNLKTLASKSDTEFQTLHRSLEMLQRQQASATNQAASTPAGSSWLAPAAAFMAGVMLTWGLSLVLRTREEKTKKFI